MGFFQAIQAQPCKVGVGPAMMILPFTQATTPAPLPQDAPKPSTHPAVDRAERRLAAVLEVAEPATQRPVQSLDYRPQALSVGPPRLGPHVVSQLLQALLP